jgi:hypothetical protein
VRQQPGLLERERAHLGEVLDGRLAAEGGQLVAGDAVPAFGLVPEREQRLLAVGRGAGAGDLQPPRRV